MPFMRLSSLGFFVAAREEDNNKENDNQKTPRASGPKNMFVIRVWVVDVTALVKATTRSLSLCSRSIWKRKRKTSIIDWNATNIASRWRRSARKTNVLPV